MNLLRKQAPYRFIAPKYSPWFQPILRMLTPMSLRIQHKVSNVEISGAEPLAKLAKAGHSILVTPNHADHADPELMMTVGHRYGLPLHFMAAREGFEKSRINTFVMRRGGAFSVNREGSDVASIKMAIKILEAGKHPLVIFPEGEIYHHMEKLDELNEGVASIALRAASKLADGKKGYIAPAAIRLHYDSNVEAVFSERLSALESSITWKPRVGNDAVNRIMDLGSDLLSIKEEEYFGAATAGSLEDRLTALRSALVGRVEKAHNALNESMSTPKRIKAIRALIRKELTSEENPPSVSRSETLYDQLDQVFLAHQLYSYPGIYLLENPSRHRIAETIFKLEEDVFGKGRYLGAREAEVVFDTPIEIDSFLSESGMNVKTGVGLLTELTRERIQKLMAS